ncbi:hypothetical protein [Carnobacterium jeotgali]
MINGSVEFIAELENNLVEIDQDILDLEKGIEKLELKIDTKNEFKIDTIKKNKTIQSEINMLKKALNSANKKREEIVQSNAERTYKDVKEIISRFKDEQRNTTNDKNLQIVQKIEEIRSLHSEINTMDKEVEQEIQQFIEQVKVHLDKEPQKDLILYGESITQYEQLQHNNRISFLEGTTFVNDVKEMHLGIQGGLYKPIQLKEKALDELKERLVK